MVSENSTGIGKMSLTELAQEQWAQLISSRVPEAGDARSNAEAHYCRSGI